MMNSVHTFLFILIWEVLLITESLAINVTTTAPTVRHDSCVQRCDESYFPGRACYCNELCDQYENCCFDYYDECRPDFVWTDDWVEYSDHLYKFFSSTSLSGAEARQECRSEGGLLVSISDQQELDFVALSVLKKRTLSAFVGGNDIDGSWTWSDGSPMPMPTSPWHTWYPGQPENLDGTSSCVVVSNFLFWKTYMTMLSSYVWRSYSCDVNANIIQGYVCEKTLLCEPNPCHNGGSCQYIGGDVEMACSCVDGYVGDRCQYQLIEGATWTECGITDLVAGSDVMRLTSPLYPQVYPPNTRCVWNISTEVGKTIQLSLDTLSIEDGKDCIFDHLTIYDGGSGDAILLGPLCGSGTSSNIEELTSSSNRVLVEFATDKSVNQEGFVLSYSEQVCGRGTGQSGCDTPALYTAQCGTIELTRGPLQADVPCEMVIRVAEGHVINVTVTEFNVHDSGKMCPESAFMVFDGQEATDDHLIGSYCGFRFPWSVQSRDNHMILKLWGNVWDDSVHKISLHYNTYESASVSQLTTNPTHQIKLGERVQLFSSDEYVPTVQTSQRHVQQFLMKAKPGGKLVVSNIRGHWQPGDVLQIYDGYDRNSRMLIDLTLQDSYNLTTAENDLHSTGFQIFVLIDKSRNSDSFLAFNILAYDFRPTLSGCYRPHYSDLSDDSATPLENHLVTELEPVVIMASEDASLGYEEGTYCKWTIRGLPGHSMSLSFLEPNIPPLSEDCHYDGVVVYDGETMHGPYCGSSAFDTILTSGNVAEVVFYSDTAWGKRNNGKLRILARDMAGCPVYRMESETTHAQVSDCGVVLSPGLPGLVAPGLWTWIIQASDVTTYFTVYVHYVRGPGVKEDCEQIFKVIEVSHDAGTLKQHESPVMTVCGSTELFVPERRLRLPQYQKIGLELNTLSNSIAHRWEFKLSYKAEVMEKPVTQSDEYICPEEYVYWRRSCYKYFPWVYRHYQTEYDFQQTWQKSLEHCEQHENGTLLSLHDEEEAGFIKYTLANEWTWDRAGTYQSNGRLVFIGLHNKYGRYQWTDGSQLSYADWYLPRQEWEQPILFGDTIGTDFLNLKNPQPTADVGSLCTALIVTSPFESLNWAKVPCDYPIFRSGLICEQKAKKRNDTDSKDVSRKRRSSSPNVQENSVETVAACPKGWFMLQHKCLQLLTDYDRVRSTDDHHLTYVDAVAKCTTIGGTPAQVNVYLIEDLKGYLKLWRHDTSTGHIWVMGDDNNLTIIKVYKDNSQDEVVHYDLGTFDNNSSYPQSVLCETASKELLERCEANEFQCAADHSCIMVDSVCDGHSDCPDASDELNCGCTDSSFRCLDGHCISISLYCDFRNDCSDGSDEQFCVLPACEKDEFTCSNGQCIPSSQLCDFKLDCKDGSDEDSRTCESYCKGMQCYSGTCIPRSLEDDLISDCPGLSAEDEVQRTLVTFFDFYLGDQKYNSTKHVGCDEGEEFVQCRDGEARCYRRSDTCIYDTAIVDAGQDLNVQSTCRDGAHLRNNCEIADCPTMFHCPASFCVPHRKVCDGLKDCPDGADELNCDNYTCPGLFRCKGETFCISHDEVCDGAVHCPKYGDDEKYCSGSEDAHRTAMTNSTYEGETLCSLGCTCTGHIVNCTNAGISVNLTANHYPTSTRALLLSGNDFRLNYDSFREVQKLARLVLSRNNLMDIPNGIFRNLHNLYDMDLSSNHLEMLQPLVFQGLISLENLNLDNNGMVTLERQTLAPLVRIQKLVLTNNILAKVEQDLFEDIPTLHTLHSDAYRFCCIAPQADICTPEPDEFSSCDDLMANYTLRVAIWVLGFFACVGNFFVIVWRLKKKSTLISSFYIINLGFSDFLMGVYMLIIASVDMFYRGKYIIYDEYWRSSSTCKFAGILAMLSSEVSVFMLTAITLDRVVNLLFPLKRNSFRMKHARIVVSCGWGVCFLFSIIPGVGIEYFGNNFFGKTGVCLPFQVSNQKTDGWEYGVFIFLALNLLSFVAIFLGYAGIFFKVKSSMEKMRDKSTSTTDEYSLAKKLVIIVATDFLCWVPIIMIGIAGLAGAKIDPEVSAWIAVFILPLNSAVNPILYTISAIDCSKKKRGRSGASTSGTASTYVTRMGRKNNAYEPSISDGSPNGTPKHITSNGSNGKLVEFKSNGQNGQTDTNHI